ncbi:MAG: ATPase, T2SS/T4P/T4SS family [Actinobacteria bacterium]|nr:ATPase, T2SS/T4P/T4SS family [Actinomycetota bacterium]
MLADDEIEAAGAPGGDPGEDGGDEGEEGDGAPPGVAAVGRDDALRAVQVALIKEIDAAISKLERARIGETTHEHLEILRSLLKAQVGAYLEYFVARRATLFSHTSVMYAGEVAAPGVLSTTFRGLLDAGTFTGGQGATLAQFIGDRRTLVIFGERTTGKSTLLNSLFELVAVDDRFVAIERGPDLPALKERSFCVRLGVDADTNIPSLFAKARRMDPGRLIVGEIHRAEVREFFSLLAEDLRVGGLATLRADSVGRAVDAIVAAFGGDDAYARELIARVKPAFLHMHSDETGRPRLAAIWSVAGLVEGELALEEVDTGVPAASRLVAEA